MLRITVFYTLHCVLYSQQVYIFLSAGILGIPICVQIRANEAYLHPHILVHKLPI
jgi:hypothetical protein